MRLQLQTRLIGIFYCKHYVISWLAKQFRWMYTTIERMERHQYPVSRSSVQMLCCLKASLSCLISVCVKCSRWWYLWMRTRTLGWLDAVCFSLFFFSFFFSHFDDSCLWIAVRSKEYGRSIENILNSYIKFVKPSFDDYIFPVLFLPPPPPQKKKKTYCEIKTKRHADIIIPRGRENQGMCALCQS